MLLGPAQVLEVDVNGANVTPYVGAAILHGWALKETSDTNRAELELHDGQGGPLVVPINLTAGGSTRDWLSGVGIYIRTGIYIVALSGSVHGSLWFMPTNTDHEPFDLRQAFDDLIETVWVR